MYIRNPITGEVRNAPQSECLALRKYGWVWALAQEYREWIVRKALILHTMASTTKH